MVNFNIMCDGVSLTRPWFPDFWSFSRCIHEDILQMTLTFKSVDYLTQCGQSFIQSFEGHKRKIDCLLLRRRAFCQQTAFGLQLHHQLFPGSPACFPTLQILDLPVYTILKINSIQKPIPYNKCLSFFAYIHILSLENSNMW